MYIDIYEGLKLKGLVRFSKTNYNVRLSELGMIHFNNN